MGFLVAQLLKNSPAMQVQGRGRIREFEKVKLTGLGNLIDEGLGNNSLWTKSDLGLAL